MYTFLELYTLTPIYKLFTNITDYMYEFDDDDKPFYKLYSYKNLNLILKNDNNNNKIKIIYDDNDSVKCNYSFMTACVYVPVLKDTEDTKNTEYTEEKYDYLLNESDNDSFDYSDSESNIIDKNDYDSDDEKNIKYDIELNDFCLENNKINKYLIYYLLKSKFDVSYEGNYLLKLIDSNINLFEVNQDKTISLTKDKLTVLS
jgi:hypothetical protein